MNPDQVDAVHEQAAQQLRNAVSLLNEGAPPFRWAVEVYDTAAYECLLLERNEPAVALIWGDSSVSLARDDLHYVLHVVNTHPNPLQRALMVTRLRYLADALEAVETPGGTAA